MRHVKSSFLIVLMSLVIAVVSSCSRTPKHNPGELRIQISSEPVTLDPSLVEDGLGFRVLVNIMDGLMSFTNSGKITNGLAESFSISKDQRMYQFKLKSDRVWSDGTAVTAEQFIYAIQRALNPKTGSKLSSLLYGILGARDFAKGKSKTLKGVYGKGSEITFLLEKPDPLFLQYLTLPVTYPLREDILKKSQGKWDPLRDKNIPTVGSYRIEKYQRDQSITLLARPGLSPESPQKILVRVIQDESTGASLFEKNEIDVLSRIPGYDLKKYQSLSGYKVSPFLATFFIGFNLKKPPFNQKEFRQAVAGSIHKKELVSALATGEMPASSWIPKGLEGSYDFISTVEDLDPRFANAVQKVKAQNYKGKIIMGFDTSGRNSLVMEKIQADLKKNLGWDVELKNSDWKTHVRSIYTDPVSIYRFGWSSPILDPLIFLSPFTTGDPFTFTQTSNAQYDDWVTARKISQAQKFIVEDETFVIPIYHYVTTQVLGPRIKKYEVNPMGHTRWAEVSLYK